MKEQNVYQLTGVQMENLLIQQAMMMMMMMMTDNFLYHGM